jgi:hypothetical protein
LFGEYQSICVNSPERVASRLGLLDLEDEENVIFRNFGDDLPMDTV